VGEQERKQKACSAKLKLEIKSQVIFDNKK